MNPDNKPLDLAAMIFFLFYHPQFLSCLHVPPRSSFCLVLSREERGRADSLCDFPGRSAQPISQPIKFRKLKLYLKNCLFPFCVKFVPSLLFALLANCMASLAPKLSLLSFIRVFLSSVVIFPLSNMFV